ncbi:MAG: right-handed parallel beta-helix repeat-containing protein, partial [Oscillospiraceae bacterium]|nr:right-handed parallel beta-helix repeat-containing protein [Oscillospiraceae bacterium]
MAYLNIMDFGAKGDGKADDTGALVDAMARAVESEGTVYFPAGTYNIRPVKVPNHITLLGNSAWGYSSRGGKNPIADGRAVLSAIPGEGKALFDMDGTVGTRVIGLTLLGNEVGECLHGVYSKHRSTEQNIVFEDCRIANFSGSGFVLDWVWVVAIRRCIIMRNRQHGIDWSNGYDGWIIDNQITANRGAGIYAGGDSPAPVGADAGSQHGVDRHGMATVTCTGNRIEWNRMGGAVLYDSDTMQFSGCAFDHNFGPGVKLIRCKASTVTGGAFRSTGTDRLDEDSCHIYLYDCKGVSVVGNMLYGWYGRAEYATKAPTPFYGFTLGNLEGCVVASNALYHAGSKFAAFDLGGHKD